MERITHGGETKTVNASQRIIEGYAATWHGPDRVGDIIDQKAFTRTLREKKASDIAVFIGHNSTALPVGICLEAKPDDYGLWTKTLVAPTPAGDNLLGTAKFFHDQGQKLGLSIGYNTRDYRYDKLEGKTVRRLLDVDLGEYSFAAPMVVANPMALSTAVKSRSAGDPTWIANEEALRRVELGLSWSRWSWAEATTRETERELAALVAIRNAWNRRGN
jgi:HK97 family phage prohead protease